jgi:hypothetical protein
MVEVASDSKPSRSDRDKIAHGSAEGEEYVILRDVEESPASFVVRWIALATAGVAFGTACYGLIFGNYNMVITVWSVAGPIVGAAGVYWFAPRRRSEQRPSHGSVNIQVRRGQEDMAALRTLEEEELHPDDAAATLDIERILARLDAGIPEAQHAMDALLARLRTTRVAA